VRARAFRVSECQAPELHCAQNLQSWDKVLTLIRSLNYNMSERASSPTHSQCEPTHRDCFLCLIDESEKHISLPDASTQVMPRSCPHLYCLVVFYKPNAEDLIRTTPTSSPVFEIPMCSGLGDFAVCNLEMWCEFFGKQGCLRGSCMATGAPALRWYRISLLWNEGLNINGSAASS